jgi:hypothetical protein
MSENAEAVIRRAQALGKWVHVGRVNTIRRIRRFQRMGVDSVDGTCLCYGPTKNRARLEPQLLMRAFPVEAK